MRSLLQIFSLLVALLLAATSLYVSPTASAQGAVRDFGAESGFVASLNAQRAAGGLAPLTVNGSMAGAADGWTQAMVNGSFLAHASDIISGTPSGWSKVGENVGRGQSVASLTSAFMSSSTHRANIMDPAYTHIGIAVYKHPTDGRLYTTHRFAALGTPQVAAPVQAPAPTPIPPTPVPPAPIAPTPVPPAPVAPIPAPTSVPPTPAPPTSVPPTPVPPTPVPPTPVPPTPVPPTPAPPTPVPPTPVPPTLVPDFGEPPAVLLFADGDGGLAQPSPTPAIVVPYRGGPY